jgi:hypothetical protein
MLRVPCALQGMTERYRNMKTILIAALFAGTSSFAFASCGGGCDSTWGGFTGSVSSMSKSGGLAVTGGATRHGAGSSFVRNEQFSGNISGVTGTLQFDTEYGLGDPNDGITTNLSVQTLNESVQESRTTLRESGRGTFGAGGGIAKSGGIAKGNGTMGAFGFDSW